MKKYFLLGLIAAIMPSICFGARSSYTQLVREKQRKMAELEKCMGSTNGLKIAGLSTLGLSAVGVVGNLAEAQKIKEYDEYIEEKVPETMERIETSIAEEKGKLAKHEKEKETEKIKDGIKLANCSLSGGTLLKNGTCLCSKNQKVDSNGRCVSTKISDEDTDDEKKDTEDEATNTYDDSTDKGNDENCEIAVRHAAFAKWEFSKAVTEGFEDMASVEALAVENDTSTYNEYKTTKYNEIFANLKKEIDDFVIQEEPGATWSCNGIQISSDECPGKTFKDCNQMFYNCELAAAELKANTQAKDEYTQKLIENICK